MKVDLICALSVIMITGIAFLLSIILTQGFVPYPAVMTFYSAVPGLTTTFLVYIRPILTFLGSVMLTMLAAEKYRWLKKHLSGEQSIRSESLILVLLTVASLLLSLTFLVIFGGVWHVVVTVLQVALVIVSLFALLARNFSR